MSGLAFPTLCRPQACTDAVDFVLRGNVLDRTSVVKKMPELPCNLKSSLQTAYRVAGNVRIEKLE
jgi:hypothetical protein